MGVLDPPGYSRAEFDAAVSAKIQDGTSQTSGALSAAFAVRTQVSPGIIVSNPRGLRRWFASLGDAYVNGCTINVVGHSIVRGVGSDNNGTSLPASSDAPYRTQSWVAILRRMFAVEYGDCGEGGLLLGAEAGGRVNLGTATAHSSTGPLGQNSSIRIANGQSITISGPQSTEIDVWIWDGSTASGTATIVVDGGTPVNIPAPSGVTSNNPVWKKTTITGLADAPHSVVINGMTTTGNLYVPMATFRRGVPGVHVNRIGISGTSSANLVGADAQNNSNADAQGRVTAASYRVGAPDLLIIECDVNDYGNQNSSSPTIAQPGSDPVTWKSRMQTIANAAVADGKCVLFVGDPAASGPPTPETFTQDTYHQAARQIAESTDHVAFVDIKAAWGSWSQSNALGQQIAFSVHPKSKGHGRMAKIIHTVLTTPVGELASTTT